MRGRGSGREGDGDVAGPVLLMPDASALPGCVRFRFCFWRKNLLKICSRYSTRAVPAAADDSIGKGQGEVEAEQREAE